ncbi:MAG: hypothetical protein WA984_01435 [Phormidesmis sp.]
MKYWKPLTLFLVGLIAVVAIAQAHSAFSSNFQKETNKNTSIARQGSIEGLSTQYFESCLSPDQESRPAWECYEIPIEGAIHQPISVQHESGEAYQVLTFQDDEQTKFRFTPTQKGIWSFSSGSVGDESAGEITGEITINADRPPYAKGFVAAEGSKWIRSATGEAFVPQYVMYDKPDLEAGLDEFIDGHGFSGFHIINLRDLVENPAYFEAVVLKTYRRGGTTHFWLWGDEQRNLTPSTYGVDVDLLYAEIAARLAPLPGWTLGYGFDLFEWATATEIQQFRTQLRDNCSYHHLIGARSFKNEYQEVSPNLDYASWEWHHPDYQDYKDHIDKANQRPAFSEDRFRIWGSNHSRDYDQVQTRQGLWHSAMAGGVANVWGRQPKGEEFSSPYPNKEAIKTYSRFISSAFSVDMTPDNDLISDGYCLRDEAQSAICYVEAPETVQFSLEKIPGPLQIVAVDTQLPYQEVEVASEAATFSWQPPYSSDWAFRILTQTNGLI